MSHPTVEQINLIVEEIRNKQGCKATELAASNIALTFISTEAFMNAVDFCVDTGEIIEIEYNLMSMSYRTKSFYLPKDTEINIITKKA